MHELFASGVRRGRRYRRWAEEADRRASQCISNAARERYRAVAAGWRRLAELAESDLLTPGAGARLSQVAPPRFRQVFAWKRR